MPDFTDAYYYNLTSHGSREYIHCKNRVSPSFLEVFVNVSPDQWNANNANFYEYSSSLHTGNVITHFLDIQMPQKV